PSITINGEKVNGKERILYKVDTLKSEDILLLSRIRPDENKEIKTYDKIISISENISEVDAVSPFVQAQGVMRSHSISKPCVIKGIIPVKESKIANLSNNVTSGNLYELTYTKNGAILGEGLAKKLKLKYHDNVSLTGEDGIVYSLIVAGIFSSGFSATDNTFVFLNLKTAQSIRGFNANTVSGIGLHTVSLDNIKDIATRIESLTGYKAKTWEESNANILDLFKRNNNITMLLVVFVFVISGFGIANVLITIVLQKQKDIAIMKSFGMSSISVRQIFLIEGIIIGIIGSLLGMIAGHLLTNFVASLPISYGESAVIKSNHISTVQTASSYIIVGIFSILVSAVSAYVPASKAAKLKPVDILRA
ncbi:MAG: FtsX-like permease family protein, partial [Bacteroidota bacterium]|nr:FtsX-like permease family protein [Bacteroidota bacterium]